MKHDFYDFFLGFIHKFMDETTYISAWKWHSRQGQAINLA